MNSRSSDHYLAEEVRDFIKGLNDEGRHGSLVIVEGVKDAKALKSLGYDGSIFLLSHGSGLKGLSAKAEKYAKVILLLDFDRKGRSLTKKAALMLEQRRIKFDLFYRRQLASTLGGEVHHIEDLPKYIENHGGYPYHELIGMN